MYHFKKYLETYPKILNISGNFYFHSIHIHVLLFMINPQKIWKTEISMFFLTKHVYIRG